MDALTWHNLLSTPTEKRPPKPAGQPPMRAVDASNHPESVAAWFASQWFTSPLVDGAVDSLMGRISVNSQGLIGAKEILAVDGPYGVGKTSLIFDLSRRLYPGFVAKARPGAVPTWTPIPGVTHDRVPIMWVQLQAFASLKVLYGSILDFLRFPVHGTGGILASRVFRALDRFDVRLLILDDVHKLRESQQASRDIIDALHTLNTNVGERGGTLCLVGSDMTQRTLLHHPQIDSRLKTFHLDPFEITTDDGKRDWQRFLRDVENLCRPFLPDHETGFLYRTLPAYLYARTQGHMQDIQQLLKEGFRRAITAQQSMDRDLLDTVPLSERASRAEALLRTPQRQPTKRKSRTAS
ncbi:conserved protein of unknown function [Micropruina glycogenica]|uniref:AAA+ ATPase domain-containing protein n=1 Tax=Micropruina glycogenica TaxID=75385 RepID=A0A2N9JI64_9ACTN|nr:conserved protein of unknown function [Micropruina glycogenica]